MAVRMRSTVCPVCQGLVAALPGGGISQHQDLRANAWCAGGIRPHALRRGGFAFRRMWRRLTRGPWTRLD